MRRRLGRRPVGIDDTAHAMKIDASNTAVLYTRGCAFIAMRELDQAISAFELLAKSHPKSPLSAYGRARVAASRQDRAEVLRFLRESRALAKEVPGAWNPEEIQADAAFAFLKDDPGFRAELKPPP